MQDGSLAYLQYEFRENAVALTHTEVPPQIAGRGLAGALTKAALEYAEGAELPVIPECGFVVAYIKRNPQYLNIVDATHRSSLEAHPNKEGELAA